jgi:glycosyltransferase involved in cell wall biosynthesis
VDLHQAVTGRLRILHYVTQWLWLSDSFVFGPISRGRHATTVVSRGEVINAHVYPHPRVVSLTSKGHAPAEGEAAAERVAEILGDRSADLIHVHHGYGVSDGVAIAERLGIPLVVTFWGYDVTALPATDPSRYRDVIGSIDRVVVPSRFLAGKVVRLGARADLIEVIPAGVDTAWFAPTPVPRRQDVTFVGRFVEKKGVDTLLTAWPAVRRQVPDATLTLLGYGDVPPSPDRSSGVRVLLPDPVRPREQVREAIRACRVYVAPSRTGRHGDAESQHVGNLEAQAGGRPVVTTRHGAIPEFVEHGESGVLVEEDDPVGLSAALVRLLSNHGLCEELGKLARDRASTRDVTMSARRLDDLYESLVSGADPLAVRGGGPRPVPPDDQTTTDP